MGRWISSSALSARPDRTKGLGVGQRQVNVRLDEADVEILEAAGFVNGRNLTDEARAGLLSHVAKVKEDPLIKRALGVRAERTRENRANDRKVVSSLEARRERGRRSSEP